MTATITITGTNCGERVETALRAVENTNNGARV